MGWLFINYVRSECDSGWDLIIWRRVLQWLQLKIRHLVLLLLTRPSSLVFLIMCGLGVIDRTDGGSKYGTTTIRDCLIWRVCTTPVVHLRSFYTNSRTASKQLLSLFQDRWILFCRFSIPVSNKTDVPTAGGVCHLVQETGEVLRQISLYYIAGHCLFLC